MRVLHYFVCILCLVGLFSCKNKTRFQRIASFHFGIDFNNLITENDSINPLDVVNVYNGGAVGIGDFNKDGLQDIYFTGNMVPGDFDGDGNLDVVMNGNDFGTEASIGRYDALNVLMLKGNSKGGFKPLSILQRGIYIPGDGKALVKLRDNKGQVLVAASQNKDFLKIFKCKASANTIPIKPNDAYALIKYKNGQTEKQEFYCGSSFLSQSARFVNKDDNM